MSERRSLRRKPLTDCTNTPIPALTLEPKPKPNTKPALSNSLTSIGSNDAQEQRQQKQQNPSDDPPHSPTPQPNHSRISDDADWPDFEISKTYTRSSADGKKNKGKAVAVAIPTSCPPVGRVRSFGAKGKGEHKDVNLSKECLDSYINKKKKPRYAKPNNINKHQLPQDFIDKQRAYFAEIDAFELPVEVASESELE